MVAREVMTRDVKTIFPRFSLKNAAALMRKEGIGVLPVTNGDQLVGMITDRDIAIRGVADCKSSLTRVGDIMSKQVYYCLDNQPIEEVAEIMGQLKIRRLPVLDDTDNLVGIISLSDFKKSERAWKETSKIFEHYALVA